VFLVRKAGSLKRFGPALGRAFGGPGGMGEVKRILASGRTSFYPGGQKAEPFLNIQGSWLNLRQSLISKIKLALVVRVGAWGYTNNPSVFIAACNSGRGQKTVPSVVNGRL